MKRRSVVVIGAGLAGSLLCNALAADADVTLLEIGEKDRISYPQIRFVKRRLAHVKTFCFGGGGTTNLWHNGLIPIDERDVAGNDFRSVLAESRAFQDEAATKLFFKGSPYSVTYENAVSNATTLAATIGLAAGEVDCLLYPKAFRPLAVDSRVRAYYSVARIEFACADNGRIESVTFSHRLDDEYRAT